MKKALALFLLALLGLGSLQAQQSAQRLARRVLGKQARHFEFVCQKDTVDFFSLSMHGKKIRVVGNNDNSMAMGLNYYLKEYAHVDVFADEVGCSQYEDGSSDAAFPRFAW